jgi:hypothetical protein
LTGCLMKRGVVKNKTQPTSKLSLLNDKIKAEQFRAHHYFPKNDIYHKWKPWDVFTGLVFRGFSGQNG